MSKSRSTARSGSYIRLTGFHDHANRVVSHGDLHLSGGGSTFVSRAYRTTPATLSPSSGREIVKMRPMDSYRVALECDDAGCVETDDVIQSFGQRSQQFTIHN